MGRCGEGVRGRHRVGRPAVRRLQGRRVAGPRGYLASDWSKTAKIRENGEVVDLTGGACKDDVARGGVQVTKSDSELGKSEALGGDSHGAPGCGSTLADR